jgi:hypothetical protein
MLLMKMHGTRTTNEYWLLFYKQSILFTCKIWSIILLLLKCGHFFLLFMINLLNKILHNFMKKFTRSNYRPTSLLPYTLVMFCHDPNLGLMTKAKGMERHKLIMQLWSHIHTPRSVRKREGMNPHTPKWAPTLGIEVLMDS